MHKPTTEPEEAKFTTGAACGHHLEYQSLPSHSQQLSWPTAARMVLTWWSEGTNAFSPQKRAALCLLAAATLPG